MLLHLFSVTGIGAEITKATGLKKGDRCEADVSLVTCDEARAGYTYSKGLTGSICTESSESNICRDDTWLA